MAELSEIMGVQLEPKTARSILARILEFSPKDWNDVGKDVSAAGVRGLGSGAARRGLSFVAVRSELDDRERGQVQFLSFARLVTRRDSAINGSALSHLNLRVLEWEKPRAGQVLVGLIGG